MKCVVGYENETWWKSTLTDRTRPRKQKDASRVGKGGEIGENGTHSTVSDPELEPVETAVMV
jgi:hypothetical protein